VTAFLDATGVRLGTDGSASAEGTLVAPDRRGGCWVRVGGRLLRSADALGERLPGATVGVVLHGALRALSPGGEPEGTA
jgi:hypothetical protein